MAENIDEPKPETATGAQEGEVTELNKEKGFGMIRVLSDSEKTDIGNPSKTQKELYFNLRTLAEGTNIMDITKGTRVSLDVAIGKNGPIAVNIKKKTD